MKWKDSNNDVETVADEEETFEEENTSLKNSGTQFWIQIGFDLYPTRFLAGDHPNCIVCAPDLFHAFRRW